jgi:FG-GAP repeat
MLHGLGHTGRAQSLGAASSAALPDGLLAPLSRSIGAAEPAYAVRAVDGGFRGYAQGGRLRADFTRGGVRVTSATTSASLSAPIVGPEPAPTHAGAISPSAHGNRVGYARTGLDEWYVNGPLGLEQGFTVFRAPAAGAGRSLAVSMAIGGNVRPSLAQGGRALLLAHAGGPSLRYGELSARDASGRPVPSRLSLSAGTVTIHLDTARALYPLTIDPLIELSEARPTPIGASEAGRFGFAIALSADGGTALVGAPGDSGSAGAAFVFTRAGSTWTQQGPKLTVNEATNAEEERTCAAELNECGFGRSVALSADGDTALIGAPRANAAQGAAWVFTRAGASWSQFGEKLTGTDEAKGNGSFGRSVALAGDGQTALVGAPRDRSGHGSAWAFARSGSGFFAQGARLSGAEEVGDAFFGRSVALSADGTTALIGGPGDDQHLGAAWAFARIGGQLAPEGGKLTGGAEEIGDGRFGYSVALSADGSSGLVGARADAAGVGAAWPIARSGSTWELQGPKLVAGGELGEGQFGYAVALSGDGSTALVGAPSDRSQAGATWTFSRVGAAWTQDAEQRGGDGEDPQQAAFGMGLALSADASTALIGAPREGRRFGGAWTYLGSPPPVEATPPPSEEEPTSSSSDSAQGAGGTPSSSEVPRGGVLASTTTALPAPRLAITGNVLRLSGTVRVKLPGSRVFTLLSGGEQIPFGSIVDATRGRVSVTTATANGGTQTMVFYQGEFKLTQHRDGLVVSALFGGSFAGCRSSGARTHRARSSASRKHAVRKLWAEGHGSYSTKGSYATGAVLGTRWLTEDLCEGTLIRVLTDRVAVTNLLTHRHVTVTAGHSYLAKAPRRRAH